MLITENEKLKEVTWKNMISVIIKHLNNYLEIYYRNITVDEAESKQ